RHLRPPLRPPLLPLPPRRPPPHRPAPHPQGARQDPLRLRPQGVAPRGPHRARRTQAPQGPAPRGPPAVGSPAARAGPAAEAQGGAALIAGRARAQAARHFFPDVNAWLDRPPDTRLPGACTYPARSLAWGGLALYLLPLGSRRQPDHGLRDGGPRVLANLNRLARAAQTTPPAHDTLDHLPGHVKLAGWERPRARMARRLARMKALGAARLLGRPVLL